MGLPTEMTADYTNLVCLLHFASNSSQSSGCKDSGGFQYRKNFREPPGEDRSDNENSRTDSFRPPFWFSLTEMACLVYVFCCSLCCLLVISVFFISSHICKNITYGALLRVDNRMYQCSHSFLIQFILFMMMPVFN